MDLQLRKKILEYRRFIVVLAHLSLIVFANYTAFLLRFDGYIPPPAGQAMLRMLPWLLLVRAVSFVPFHLYEGVWRYTGVWDLANILAGVLVSTATFWPLLVLDDSLFYPRSIPVIDSVVLIFMLGGIRLGRRIYHEFEPVSHEKTILIYGAGDAGEMIVRDMKQNSFYDRQPIGFVDDDPVKQGRRIHNLPVLGTRRDLLRIMTKHAPDEILIALPGVEPSVIRGIVEALRPFKVPIKTVPNLRDVLSGKVEVSQIRKLSVEDLLPRAPVGIDPRPLHELLKGKRVLVTGAGGSIGAELCRQVARLGPERVVMFERYENNLYAIEADIAAVESSTKVFPVIGDIIDQARLKGVFAEHRPDIVFHAAAHKHVPLMEANPCEAVKNNILGTRLIARAAHEYGVARFILISTDKAVSPTSVMGATKRVAELIVREMDRRSPTAFAAVRFGNVLGSNGSVVPRFIQQIKTGGPVTVTHPEMRRYFMLIPEAVHLVLHAAAMAESGDLFVLDMGEQIGVLDMARDLIRLMGYVPDEDIRIEFVGLRPGEKLQEQLTASDETTERSGVEKIQRVKGNGVALNGALELVLAKLERLAIRGDSEGVLDALTELVPSFTHNPPANETSPCLIDQALQVERIAVEK